MVIELKIAEEKDFKDIARIYSEEFSKPPYNEKWTISIAIYKLRRFKRYCDVYKVLLDKKIVGFIAVDPCIWLPKENVFISEFAIKSEYQGKGIGKSVCKDINDIYKRRGFKFLMFNSNKKSKAYKIYKKWGYKEDKQIVFFKKRL